MKQNEPTRNAGPTTAAKLRERSPFLQVMRKRFDQKNDPEHDPVPWRYDDKFSAYEFVASRGFAVPAHSRAGSAREALVVGGSYGDRFVVKQPNRHSTKGVYVLETIGKDRYLDLFSLAEIAREDIKAVGSEPDYWLAEASVPSYVAGRPLPFDYKVYAFRGEVSHVVQIDRNIYPPRVAVFDGAFIPLRANVDYATDPSRWGMESHVLPKHAGAILHMAATLSAELDTRFVRVDCFDGPDGPIFGEFTFASGPDDIGMLTYSDEVLAALDIAIQTGQVGALSGFDVDMAAFRQSLTLDPTLEAHDLVYERLSAGGVDGDLRYAQNMLRYVADGAPRHIHELSLNLIGLMNGDGERAFRIQSALRKPVALIKGPARLAEFVQAGLDFHEARAHRNHWHTSRAAEIRIMGGDVAALDVLRRTAAEGYEHAARVLKRYEASSAASTRRPS